MIYGKIKIFVIFVFTILVITNLVDSKILKLDMNVKKMNDYNYEFVCQESNFDFNYFISIKDHSDVLSNLSIDKIAVIKLDGSKDINISDLKILISSDMINWHETKIIEKGIWFLGEEIIIQELCPNQIIPSYFDVRVFMPSIRQTPVAEGFVQIDSASIKSFTDERPIYRDNYSSEFNDMTEFKSSSAYKGDSTLILHAISLGVQFVDRRWDQFTGTWDYTFYLDGCWSTEFSSVWNRLIFLELLTYRIAGDYDRVYIRTGGQNLDEYEETDLEKIAIAVCECAIGAINPIIDFMITATELADELGHAPDVKWQAPENELVTYASGFSYQKIYVLPKTYWQIEYDFKCTHMQGIDQPSFTLDYRIPFGETSPEEPNDAPCKPIKPTGDLEGLTGKNYEYISSTTDPENHDIYYMWDWDDGTMSEWRGPYNSGEIESMWHAHTDYGIYDIRVKAKDFKGKESPWSDSLTVIRGNPPIINWFLGPYHVKKDEENRFSWCGKDNDNDDIYYYIDWGDGTISSWFGPYKSEDEVSKCHFWSSEGIYVMKLRAKDSLGLHSEWKIHQIEVTKFKSNLIQVLIKVVFVNNKSFECNFYL